MQVHISRMTGTLTIDLNSIEVVLEQSLTVSSATILSTNNDQVKFRWPTTYPIYLAAFTDILSTAHHSFHTLSFSSNNCNPVPRVS